MVLSVRTFAVGCFILLLSGVIELLCGCAWAAPMADGQAALKSHMSMTAEVSDCHQHNGLSQSAEPSHHWDCEHCEEVMAAGEIALIAFMPEEISRAKETLKADNFLSRSPGFPLIDRAKRPHRYRSQSPVLPTSNPVRLYTRLLN